MDWLLACFRCGQRRQTRRSIARHGTKEVADQVSVTNGSISANDTKEGSSSSDGVNNPASRTLESEKALSVLRSDCARTSSGCIKPECRHLPTSEDASDHLAVVKKREEEMNILNEELVAEASQARIAAHEIKHLRQCSELLESSDVFKRALEDFKRDSYKDEVVETRPLLCLQSMLSKTGTSEVTVDTFLEMTMDNSIPKIFNKESSSLASFNEAKRNSISSHGTARLASDQLQMESLADSQGPELKQEHSASIPVCCPPVEEVDSNFNRSQAKPVRKRRSSTTYSFSGFIVIENEIEDQTATEHAVSEPCRSTEASVTSIIETTDKTSDNLVETSKSLFAFATTSLKRHSIVTERSLSHSNIGDFRFLRADSEMDVSAEGQGAVGNLYMAHESANSLQSESAWVGQCTDTSVGQSQAEISEDSYDWSSNISSGKRGGLSNRIGYSSEEAESQNCTGQLHMTSVRDEQSVTRNANLCLNNSQWEVNDHAVLRNLDFADVSIYAQSNCYSEVCNRMHVNCLNGQNVVCLESEERPGLDTLFSEDQLKLKALVDDKQATFSYPYKCPDSRLSALGNAEVSEDSKFLKNLGPFVGSPSSYVSQAEPSELVHDPITGSRSIEAPLSTICLCNDPSKPVNAPSASPPECRDEIISFTESPPSTPVSVTSHASGVILSKNDPYRPQITPARTTLPSFWQTETPNFVQTQISPTNLGEDRPILGTVAAHWNHSSSSTTKWWDGKGIPNSTNKYKEDQKVSWHATPFEVRLERALAKQGRVFQKKLFRGAAEMEVTS